MRRTFVAAVLAVPLLALPLVTVPSAAASPTADLAALEQLAAELKTAQPWAGAARAAATTAPTAVTAYRIDAKRGVVAVGVERVTPALTAAARETFGDSVVLHQADRMYRFSRANDAAPHRAGAEIVNSATRDQCTIGFAVNRPAATPVAMMTAGHCARGLGDTFTNNGRQFGSVVQRERASGSLDAALVGTSAQGVVYTGNRTSSATARVVGVAEPFDGDTVCHSGAVTAENCTGQVSGTNLCIPFEDGTETCAVDRFVSTNGQRLSARGDSGGPVYVYTGAGTVNAVGMVVAGNSDGTQVAYHTIDTVLQFFGATSLVTG